MTLKTLAAMHKMSFPSGITTVGVELEGYWDRPFQSGTPPEPEECEYCVWEADDGFEDSHYHEDTRYGHWERCLDCQDILDGNNVDFYEGHNSTARSELGLKADGSVYCPDGLTESHVSGEAASTILHTWGDVVEFVSRMYPAEVDYKCGLHVHMGCTRDQWAFAFNPTYWQHLNQTLAKIGEGCSPQTREWLENRLAEGRSDLDEGDCYCAPNTTGDRYGRYWAVNYNAWADHGTLEVRVNPMAVSAIPGADITRRRHSTRQVLNLIYGTLQATSNYWTQPAMWPTEQGRVTLEEDLALSTTPADPEVEHVTITC
jgi:hypothetical protein